MYAFKLCSQGTYKWLLQFDTANLSSSVPDGLERPQVPGRGGRPRRFLTRPSITLFVPGRGPAGSREPGRRHR